MKQKRSRIHRFCLLSAGSFVEEINPRTGSLLTRIPLINLKGSVNKQNQFLPLIRGNGTRLLEKQRETKSDRRTCIYTHT